MARAKRHEEIDTLHSLETGEGSRPAGRGEVGSDATSSPERKRRASPSLDPKRFMRLSDEFAFIDPAWAKTRAWLYKRYGHFEFLKVLEVQKTGRPHLHILLSGILHVPHADLYAVWQKYGGGYVWVRRIEGGIDAVSYVLKYVNKTVLGEDKTYAALLFASNKRMFSMSHGLRDMLFVRRKTEKQGYFFEGTVGESEVRTFCLEQNLVYDDFVRANVTVDILYQYRELFDVRDI